MVNGEIIACEQKDLGRAQSAELPRMAERVMKGFSWNELDYVALTNGPGYFTGIRVGAAYASGVAYACGAKIIPVSSLDVLAESSGLSGKILALVYAGHGFVYAQCAGCLEAGEYPVEAVRTMANIVIEAEKIGLCDILEKLQFHPVEVVYDKTVKLLEEYFETQYME